MTRRELLTWCVSGVLTGGVACSTATVLAQEQPGRVRLNSEQPSPPTQPQQTNRVPRPEQGNIQLQMPRELEDLLLQWERESAQVRRLRGNFHFYKYDGVYFVETRSEGEFWYESPDKGRMDFGESTLPPVSKKKGPNGEAYTVQQREDERWICTGTEIFIIHDEQKLFDHIEIPLQQQGQNIINGPLPFLFGMKAVKAKERYFLNLGSLHWPQGKVEEKDGKRSQYPPQIHVVAVPKLEQDQKEWSRAEVILNGSFLPRAIKLLDPTGNAETVYVFEEAALKVNEPGLLWLPNPFEDRPPRNYTLGHDSRAAAEEMPALDQGIAPTGGQRSARP
jgi:TIGR03009 family protein